MKLSLRSPRSLRKGRGLRMSRRAAALGAALAGWTTTTPVLAADLSTLQLLSQSEFRQLAQDFGAIASRLKDAKPDFIYAGVIAMEGMMLLDAMKKIDYKAPPMFHHLPSPGPMVNSPDAQGMLVATLFEEHEPMLSQPGAKDFVPAFNQRAKAAGAPVEADISKLEPGAMIKVVWRGQAVYVVHRTPEMLATLTPMKDQLREPYWQGHDRRVA